MSAEFWAVLGVGVAILSLGVTGLVVGWHMFNSLRGDISAMDRRLNAVDRRLVRIEGWIEGRFKEGAAATP